MKSLIVLVISITVLLFACDDKRLDTKKVVAQLKDRKIKKISQAAITEAALETGDSMVKKLEAAWMERIKSSIGKNDLSQAANDCMVEKYALTDSLERTFTSEIKRVSAQPRNSSHSPQLLEKQIWEAYQYAAEQKTRLNSNVQSINEEYLLYTAPITIKDASCIQCHGKKEQLDKSLIEMFQKKYPEDKSVNFKEGDLIGVWSIKLHKKEIIQSIGQ